ncbi:MAG: tRNA (N6-isopentenyl adenosine(37)-C2)-methylthiotransferase MiaB [Oscillospiraceae bacterium]
MFNEEQIKHQTELCNKIDKILFDKYGYSPKAYVHTYGCQQNVSDSEKIKGLLTMMGYSFTETIADADFVLFNTCAIREGAETKIFGNVGELKLRKKQNPNIIISLCGCMVQQDRIIKKVQKSYPFVDLIFGTHMIHSFPELLYSILQDKKKIARNDDGAGTIPEYIPTYRNDNIKVNVPIMNGCNNFCTYCIVPYVRGREMSREKDDIINEVKELVKNGCKEITLLGQNVNSYGSNLIPQITFSQLLKELNAIDGDFIIRFLTSHPKDCTFDLIDTIADCQKVCKHIHLPIQSGSNNILKLMNRGYTVEKYIELFEYARKKIPDITFSSDIIVGFPSEEYTDFLKTVELVKKIQFNQIFTFIYSKRPGTRAALMEDNISENEKSIWLRELLLVQSEIGLALNKKLIGNETMVLVDGYGKSVDGCLTGRTYNNTIVDFIAPKSLIGSFVKVKITKATPFATFGEIII